MKAQSVNRYFRPYGLLGTNRLSNLRSFLVRVISPFDNVDDPRRDHALRETLGQEDLQNLLCVFCGKAAQEWDHLVEAAQGGGHQIGNLVPACMSCNRRRGDWELRIDRLGLVEGESETRKARIRAYQILRAQPGESLPFTDEERAALDAGLLALQKVIAEIDVAISAATERYRSAALASQPLLPAPKRGRKNG